MAVNETAATPTRLVADIRVGVWDGYTPPTSYSDILSATPLTITTAEQASETLIAVNASNLGEVIDSGATPTGKAARVSLTSSTMTSVMRAMFLGASVTELTLASVAVADEPVTLVMHAWTRLANAGILPHGLGTEIVLETPGTPDVEIDADMYEIDLGGGFIRPLHADAVGAKKISYFTPGATYEVYAAGGATSEYVHITGSVTDQASGFVSPIDLWRCQLSAKGEFDPTTNKFMNVVLEGDLVSPKNALGEWIEIQGRTPSSPWEYHRRTA